jgi:hypothetical protein
MHEHDCWRASCLMGKQAGWGWPSGNAWQRRLAMGIAALALRRYARPGSLRMQGVRADDEWLVVRLGSCTQKGGNIMKKHLTNAQKLKLVSGAGKVMSKLSGRKRSASAPAAPGSEAAPQAGTSTRPGINAGYAANLHQPVGSSSSTGRVRSQSLGGPGTEADGTWPPRRPDSVPLDKRFDFDEHGGDNV